ncbi:hypothetical protein ACQPYK_22715 [Streptosporangium sp. CA-135522]|uniref:hypothetical protein n=1 Tax=Streptosporangium sp. CA-135522 TaxID=3240072 RepID=UPI003D94E484
MQRGHRLDHRRAARPGPRAAGSAHAAGRVDGASRVYDPIIRGEAGHPVHGVLLKDYEVAPW